MRVLTAPYYFNAYNSSQKTLFLAGGITNCPEWQNDVLDEFKKLPVTIFNPRRENFPIEDPNASVEQIKWEHRHLELADGIMFWFPKESICPIVLFELGKYLRNKTNLFIGTHLKYPRRQDVVIQTKLVREDLTIHTSINDLCTDVIDNFVNKKK